MPAITIIGAGPLARSSCRHLLAEGHEILIATRSGTELPGARAVRADVTRPGGFDALPASRAIIACCNFPYTARSWERSWPRAIDALIGLAERDGAHLVIAGNLYAAERGRMPIRAGADGPPPTPMGSVRAEVWRRALTAHGRGRIRASEIRGSDYFGAEAGWGSGGSYLNDHVLAPLLRGRPARVLGDPDAPRSWTAITDFGRMLARAACDEGMAGRAWHVPNAPALSVREVAALALRLSGRGGAPALRRIPGIALRALGTVHPVISALHAQLPSFTAPFIVDDEDSRQLLGETHTPLVESLAELLRHPA